MRRKPLLLLLAVVVFIAAALFLWSHTKSAAPPFIGANRIGYYNLIRAVNLLEDSNPYSITNRMAAFLKTNAAALNLVRHAIKQPCEAPPEIYETGKASLIDFSGFRSLALVLRIEGLHAKLQLRPADAARSYLDIIRLGQKIESGPLVSLMTGLLSKKWVSNPSTHWHRNLMEQLAPKLPPP